MFGVVSWLGPFGRKLLFLNVWRRRKMIIFVKIKFFSVNRIWFAWELTIAVRWTGKGSSAEADAHLSHFYMFLWCFCLHLLVPSSMTFLSTLYRCMSSALMGHIHAAFLLLFLVFLDVVFQLQASLVPLPAVLWYGWRQTWSIMQNRAGWPSPCKWPNPHLLYGDYSWPCAAFWACYGPFFPPSASWTNLSVSTSPVTPLYDIILCFSIALLTLVLCPTASLLPEKASNAFYAIPTGDVVRPRSASHAVSMSQVGNKQLQQ